MIPTLRGDLEENRAHFMTYPDTWFSGRTCNTPKQLRQCRSETLPGDPCLTQRKTTENNVDWLRFFQTGCISVLTIPTSSISTQSIYIYIYYIALLPIVAIESIQSGWVDHVWRVNLGKYSIITWIVGIGQPNIMRSLRYVVIQLMPSIRFTSGSWDHARAINLF